MTSNAALVPPFRAALGRVLDEASPMVRRHLACVEPSSCHVGHIRQTWAHGAVGWLASKLLRIGGRHEINETEERFELRNELHLSARRGTAMTWQRTHYASNKATVGIGLIHWDAARRALVDVIGERGWLEVELVPAVEGRSVVMRSRRQWLRLGPFRVRLPRVFFGDAYTREWEEPDGRLGLALTLHHPLFGAYAGYEALLTREEPQ